jgi:hypothetical protein
MIGTNNIHWKDEKHMQNFSGKPEGEKIELGKLHRWKII